MNENIKIFKFNAIPFDFDYEIFLNSMLNRPFIICHDLSKNQTSLIVNSAQGETLSYGNVDIELERTELGETSDRFKFLAFYFVPKENTLKREKDFAYHPLSDLYTILGGLPVKLFLSFIPSENHFIMRMKDELEEKLSEIDVRLTKTTGIRPMSGPGSLHSDLYYNSDNKKLFAYILGMLNEIILSNCTSYKVALIIEINEYSDILFEYLRPKFLVLDEFEFRAVKINDILNLAGSKSALPFSYSSAACLIDFSDKIKRLARVKTRFSGMTGDITVGSYLNNSIGKTNLLAKIDHNTLNLGTLITGLPGTGKTTTAMSIISQLKSFDEPNLIIISPNEEWNLFGLAHNLKIVNPYTTDIKINFFRCDSDVNIAQFYENLAMLIASASNAGPYRNSAEKCLLAAFTKIYSLNRNPDPQEVYEQIGEEIIEQHGKRTKASVKYTKHGENIRAAFEDLRLMLMKPQFAYKNGVNFGALLKQGAVFDLSDISNKMKPLFYALILNQVYSFADSFDVFGDNKLRLVLCIEEAQLIFDREETSAASFDLSQRIQNFRKKGVALILITHNATDINQVIRRLCQNKLYFRQSADVAKYAANDMIFDEILYTNITDKLKTLDQFVCSLTYVNITKGGKAPESSIFVRSDPYFYEDAKIDAIDTNKQKGKDLLIMNISLEDSSGIRLKNTKVELLYLDEKVINGATDENGDIKANNILRGKRYRLVVLGEKRGNNRTFDLVGQKHVTIKLSS